MERQYPDVRYGNQQARFFADEPWSNNGLSAHRRSGGEEETRPGTRAIPSHPLEQLGSLECGELLAGARVRSGCCPSHGKPVRPSTEDELTAR